MRSSENINAAFIDDLKKDIINHSQSEANCFIAKSANQWIEEAKLRPIPEMLFGELWFEGEVCILFADTNTGKSILAVQIANSISIGVPIGNFNLEVKPQKVIYLDFELTDKQFEKRYSDNYTNHYEFSDNLIRAEINPEIKLPEKFKSFEDYLVHSIYELIKEHQAKVIIIDNITYLKTDNERAKDALSLMKELKAISKNENISILALAHTPKRNPSNPITKNDLAGSKMLINFCDSAFAIGESNEDSSVRYIKQIKQRNTECIYHIDNIALFQIKQEYNFLNLSFIGFDAEENHLRSMSRTDKEERNRKIIEFKSAGYSNVKVASMLSISEGTVRNVLREYK